jgi:epoxyqueuosine reductase
MSTLALEKLKELGHTCGFDVIGATDASPFPELIPRLQAYEERGLTGFEWSDIDARINPKKWFPEAKSMISVAMAYLTNEGYRAAKSHPHGKRHGLVTVYSFGEDYHRVMHKRLEDLQHLIEEELGHPIGAKMALDTSPMVDRRVAERAGIGWVGKNCLFYTPQHGSFVFLGTLLVDIEISGEAKEQESKCGSCTACIDACPTGALLAPGVIDATRCLSYITQMKGLIPRQYRVPMGRRVWGCDTCQWACPENKGVLRSTHEEYLPQGELEYPDLIDVLHLSQKAFQRRFGHTAAAWRGLRTWQRNALIALGNSKCVEAVQEIIPFLQSPRPELRASAAWALMRIDVPDGFEAIRQARSVEEDPVVLEEMDFALGGVKSE